MTLGTDIQTEITAMLNAMGKSLTLRVVAEGTYDSATGVSSSGSTTDYAVFGVLYDYRDKDRDESRVQMGDRLCALRGLNILAVPSIGDRIVDRTRVYNIIDVQEYEVQNAVAAYVCQVRTV